MTTTHDVYALLIIISHVCAYSLPLAKFSDIYMISCLCFAYLYGFCCAATSSDSDDSTVHDVRVDLLCTSPRIPPGWAVNLSNQPHIHCLYPLALPSLKKVDEALTVFISLHSRTLELIAFFHCLYCVWVSEFQCSHEIPFTLGISVFVSSFFPQQTKIKC